MIRLLALHIPDGFLSLPVALVGQLLMIACIGLALRQTRHQLGERQIPLMGVLAAFIFAAQMINFPVAGGTSGHLLGGTLAAILLGPWAAVIVMTSVIAVQALMFQDGGLLALGFNVVNMGVITIFIGYAVYKWSDRLFGKSQKLWWMGAVLGAWVSVIVAAIATSIQLAASGTTALGLALPAMIGVHTLIGIGEALITVGALGFIRQTRPDLLDQRASTRGTSWIAVGLALAIMVALFSPLASPHPDGLERVATNLSVEGQFNGEAESAPYEVMPDYTIPFIENAAVSTIAAGIAGILLVTAAGYGVARLNRRETRPNG